MKSAHGECRSVLAENIRRFRLLRGMRQSDLAKALDVDTTAVTKWESGASRPKYPEAIASALAVTTDALFGLGDSFKAS